MNNTIPVFFLIIIVLNLLAFSHLSFHLGGTPTLAGNNVQGQSQTNKEKVTLDLILAHEERWDPLIDGAKEELQRRHPDKVIEIKNNTLPYEEIRPKLLDVLANGTSIDLISIDQIWLGEFAEKGMLADLTDFVKQNTTISSSDFYQANWDGGVYGDKVYAIWIWTDVRGTWYWKDLLNKAGIDPNSLRTWGRIYCLSKEA